MEPSGPVAAVTVTPPSPPLLLAVVAIGATLPDPAEPPSVTVPEMDPRGSSDSSWLWQP